MSLYGEDESNRLRKRYYPYRPCHHRIGGVIHGEKRIHELTIHMAAQGLRELLGDGVFFRFLKIFVIRNPYDQIVSYYAWRAYKGHCGQSREISVPLFREWLLDEVKTRGHRPYRQGCRQVTLTRPYDVVDFMIRFEHFEEDLTALSQRLGLTENIYDTFKEIREKRGVRPQSLTTRACFEGFFEGIERMKKRYAVELEQFGYDLPWLSGGLSGLSVPQETPKGMVRESA